MFITTLDSITAEGNKIQRVYEGKTEKLSVYFAMNLWSTYDRDHGERLDSITTYDSEAAYMIHLTDYEIGTRKRLDRDYYLREDHRSLCTMSEKDIALHA